jgi:hypothetical protein
MSGWVLRPAGAESDHERPRLDLVAVMATALALVMAVAYLWISEG